MRFLSACTLRNARRSSIPVAVASILLRQIWTLQATGEHWLMTKLNLEAFASSVVLKKGGGDDDDIYGVKVKKAGDSVELPGCAYTPDAGAF